MFSKIAQDNRRMRGVPPATQHGGSSGTNAAPHAFGPPPGFHGPPGGHFGSGPMHPQHGFPQSQLPPFAVYNNNQRPHFFQAPGPHHGSFGGPGFDHNIHAPPPPLPGAYYAHNPMMAQQGHQQPPLHPQQQHQPQQQQRGQDQGSGSGSAQEQYEQEREQYSRHQAAIGGGFRGPIEFWGAMPPPAHGHMPPAHGHHHGHFHGHHAHHPAHHGHFPTPHHHGRGPPLPHHAHAHGHGHGPAAHGPRYIPRFGGYTPPFAAMYAPTHPHPAPAAQAPGFLLPTHRHLDFDVQQQSEQHGPGRIRGSEDQQQQQQQQQQRAARRSRGAARVVRRIDIARHDVAMCMNRMERARARLEAAQAAWAQMQTGYVPWNEDQLLLSLVRNILNISSLYHHCCVCAFD